MSDHVSNAAVQMERLVAASPEAIFSLWTDPSQLMKWWGPEGYETTVDALEIRAGGRWRTVMRGSQGDVVVVSGNYRAIEPPRRLVFTWAWEDAVGRRGHETEVVVRLESVPGGTKLILVQREFESEAARDNHNRGWTGALDRLTKLAVK
jgi:uncharacterized protein YndB with AHSA1/START domain